MMSYITSKCIGLNCFRNYLVAAATCITLVGQTLYLTLLKRRLYET